MYYTYFEDTCYFYSNFLLNVKVAKSLESAYALSRSLLCRIVVKLLFQLFNNVDLFLIGCLFTRRHEQTKAFNGWHAKSWLSNCCFLSAKQKVSFLTEVSHRRKIMTFLIWHCSDSRCHRKP